MGYEVDNLVSEYTRLARACACNHKLRPVEIFHGIALLGVEFR